MGCGIFVEGAITTDLGGRPVWKRICSAGVRLGEGGDASVAEMVGCLFAVAAVLEYAMCRRVVSSPYCSVISTTPATCSIVCAIDRLLESHGVSRARLFSSF